jgi:flagellar hook-associated protein 2
VVVQLSSISSTTSASSKLRITGMASGLDVDSTVKQLMSAYNTKLDKMKQERQVVQWKQDLYRDTISSIQAFQSTYFDVLKPSSYMLSANSFAGFDVTSVKTGTSTTSEVASATAGADAIAGTYKVGNVTLAKKATSTGTVLNVLQGDSALTTPVTIDGSNNALKIRMDNTSYDISIAANTYNSITDLVAAINTGITNAVPAGLNASFEAKASPDGTKIQFSAKTNSSFNVSNGTGSTALSSLGFSSTSNDVGMTTSDKMSSLFKGAVSFTLKNGSGSAVNFNYDFSGADKDKTIAQVFSDIASKTGLSATYSELTKSFTLATNSTGVSQSIIATDTQADGNGSMFLKSLFNITTAVGTSVTKTGSNAIATITNPKGDSATVNKENNTFLIDGISYTLLKDDATADVSTITVTGNVQKPFDKIKEFVTKYNELLDKIYTKLEEKKSGYSPLTDEQKSAMSQTDIDKWEAKAKEGILRNDSVLQNVVSSLRSALYAPVPGAGIAFGDAMGIGTSSDYTQKGKLTINETKLKEALQNHGNEIAKLFTTKSSSHPVYDRTLSLAERAERTNEEGIFQRLNDILNDNVSTKRDSSNMKGTLIEKAGVINDSSVLTNLLYKDLADRDKAILDMQKKLATKQEGFYTKFSKLETIMNKLNSQSSWLTQQLGGQ